MLLLTDLHYNLAISNYCIFRAFFFEYLIVIINITLDMYFISEIKTTTTNTNKL